MVLGFGTPSGPGARDWRICLGTNIPGRSRSIHHAITIDGGE
jgi:hypothetical protein